MTQLHLTPAAQAQLSGALADTLCPAAHATLDSWRATVTESVGRLIGADWGAFIIRAPGVAMYSSVDSRLFHEYIPVSDPYDRRIGLWRRQVHFGAWSRPMLWGRFLGEMYRSSYYHDFARPIRAYDTIGLTIRDGALPLFSLHFLHESPRGARFGERGLQLLRLLQPALRVGAAAAARQFRLAPPLQQRPLVPSAQRASLLSDLTPREWEVARLLACRRSNRELADALRISAATAKRHVENVLRKVGVRSRRDVERLIVDD